VVDVSFHPEAERFEAEVDKVLNLLKANPTLFAKYDDDHRYAGVKRYPYSLIYRQQPDQILIVALAHSSRSAGYWRGRT
jgi:toxin ParE1/3/4